MSEHPFHPRASAHLVNMWRASQVPLPEPPLRSDELTTACCIVHGWTPHHVGGHGSLTCRVCVWDGAHIAALHVQRAMDERARRAAEQAARGGAA